MTITLQLRAIGLAALVALGLSGAVSAQQAGDKAHLPVGTFDGQITKIVERAEKGEAIFQLQLGQVLEHGVLGVAEDLEKAVYWYRQAAKRNQAQAQATLVALHIEGGPVAKDYVLAQMLLILANKGGYGDVLTSSYEPATDFLSKALSPEEKQLAGTMAAAWKPGDDIPYIAPNGKWGKQFTELRQKADGGDTKAQLELANAYEAGIYLPHDETLARDYFHKAAAGGNAEARDKISQAGDAFETGWKAFSAGDDEAAFKVWYPCARRRDARCEWAMGRLMRANGKPVEALNWYLESALRGFARAQNEVGMMYLQGDLVAADRKQAEKWLKLAAEQDNTSAQFNLGSLYAQGDKTPENIKQARFWLQKAADKGHANAQLYLRIIKDKK